jgi:hypothetical protein
VVKNDQDQIQAYIDACNAVKIKYPKTKSWQTFFLAHTLTNRTDAEHQGF